MSWKIGIERRHNRVLAIAYEDLIFPSRIP